MALLFIDGFDHYATTADITKKWTTAVTGGIDSTGGRRGGGGLLLSTGIITKNLPAAFSTIIVGVAYRPTTSASTSRNCIQFQDDNTVHMAVQATDTQKLAVLRGTTVLATGTTSIVAGTTYYIEFKATIHDTTGSYELRINGVTELSATNIDTRNAGNESVNIVAFNGSSGGRAPVLDDIYICNSNGTINNDFLGDCRVDTLYPTSDGTYATFTPSTGTDHYALVDETTPNTTDYNSSTINAGDRESYGLGNLPSLASQTLYGVQVNAAVLKDDAGSRALSTMVRSGTTNADGASVALPTSQVYLSQVYELNPDGNVAWTEAAVNAMEAGVKVTA